MKLIELVRKANGSGVRRLGETNMGASLLQSKRQKASDGRLTIKTVAKYIANIY